MNSGRKLPNALRHGAYSVLTVLPGEDAGEFKKLCEKITAQYNVDSDPVLQCELTNLARLLWRRQNLATFDIAAEASRVVDEISADLIPRQRVETTEFYLLGQKLVGEPPTVEQTRAGQAKAKEKIQSELGEYAKLAAMSRDLTFENLHEQLAVMERLDQMIYKCMKRVGFIKTLKSVTASDSIPERRERSRPQAKQLSAA
jgi:hypothetical protein